MTFLIIAYLQYSHRKSISSTSPSRTRTYASSAFAAGEHLPSPHRVAQADAAMNQEPEEQGNRQHTAVQQFRQVGIDDASWSCRSR